MTGNAPADVRTFVFDTTHYAMWAEDVARERKVEVEVVPAPPEVDAKCGLAIRTAVGEAGTLREAFDEEGIPYTVLGGSEDRDAGGTNGADEPIS